MNMNNNKRRKKKKQTKKRNKKKSIASHTQELIDYYRQRLDNIENEKQIFARKLRLLDGFTTTDGYEEFQTYVRQRDGEIGELTYALNHANELLSDVHNQILEATNKHNDLQDTEKKLQRTIQQLLGMNQPITQEVTYFIDANKKPDAITRPYAHQPQPVSHLTNLEAHKSRQRRTFSYHKKFNKKQEDPHIVRTIIFPNKETKVLAETEMQLRARSKELDKQLNYGRKQVDDARVQLDKDRKQVHDTMGTSIADLKKQLSKVSNSAFGAALDNVLAWHNGVVGKRFYHENKESILKDMTNNDKHLLNYHKNSEKVADEMTDNSVERVKQMSNRLQNQRIDREEQLAMLTDQYKTMTRVYENRMQETNNKIEHLRKKHKRLKSRVHLEDEGLRVDVENLLRQLVDIENLFGTLNSHPLD